MPDINTGNPYHGSLYVPSMCNGQCLIFPNNYTSLLVDTVTWKLGKPTSTALSSMCCPMMSVASSSILPLKASAQSIRSFVLNFELSFVKVLQIYAILLYKALRLGKGSPCHSNFITILLGIRPSRTLPLRHSEPVRPSMVPLVRPNSLGGNGPPHSKIAPPALLPRTQHAVGWGSDPN